VRGGTDKKKWFQVIRFPALPTAVMHGTEHRVREHRTIRRSTPPGPFSPAPGSKLPGSPQPFLSQTAPPARNGLSLARNGCPFRGLHSRVKVPGLPLRLLASRFHGPFGSSAPLPPASSHPLRLLPRLEPVAASTTRSPDGSSSVRSPAGLLHPSGSTRPADPVTRRSRLPNSPDLRSLPAA
jgi:hypothetical protein